MALIISLKVFFISIAVLFTALGFKVSVPLATTFFATQVPLIWNFCLLCFKPPYLFVIVNGIIITIVASSRFYHSAAANDPTPPPNAPEVLSYERKSPPEFIISEPPVLEVKPVMVNCSAAVEEEEEDEKAIDDGMDSMESTWTTLKRMDSTEIPPEYLPPMEKPLVSARFGHRKPPKYSPEGGRTLGVAKQKRHETLENTWRMITEGRAMPLSRHMKKCNTWQNRGSEGPPEETPLIVSVKKSDTFTDPTNYQPPPPVPIGKLRKEPSLSQDELNRRVEAFIQKFNHEMRLQRQESLEQYMEMINGGT